MYRALQGRCGLFCGECDIYIAYSTNDLEAQRKFATDYNERKGRNITPEQVKCLGCKGPPASRWHPQCQIGSCADERGVEFCYQCHDYPCDKLQGIFAKYPQAQVNLRTISKIGPDAWVAEMLARIRQRKEGGQ